MAKIKIKYTYSRRGIGPGVGGNQNCSNHHILPYYVMEYVGLLWIAYAKTDSSYTVPLTQLVPGGGVVANMSNAMTLETNKTKEYLVAEEAAPFAPFVSAFAWLSSNLFTGPKADYRLVDPSQLLEPDRPPSLPTNRWDRLNAVWTAVKAVHLPHREGDRMNTEVEEGQAKNIIDAAKAALAVGANPHTTLVSDWYATLTNEPPKKYKLDVSMMADPQFDRERQGNGNFAWCSLGVGAGTEKNNYLRVINVINGKVACIKKDGQPDAEMGNGVFVTAFKPVRERT